MIKRALDSFEGGKWCLVGGKLDDGESFEEAIIREIEEEIGLKLPLEYYAEIENHNSLGDSRWISHYFLGNSNVLPTDTDPEEASEVGFFSADELIDLDIAFDHKEVLTRYFNKNVI